MTPNTHNPWKNLRSTEVYDNPWIRVSHNEVINPSGNPGIYGLVHFKNYAVGILPIDKNQDTYLVGQYRYPLKQYSWEIPAGGCPLGTDVLDTAVRELKEEVGLSAHKWDHLMDMHLSNCVSDEIAHIFLARGLTEGQSQPEETEELSIKKIPFREAFQMVLKGEITDAISVAALLKANILFEKGLLT